MKKVIIFVVMALIWNINTHGQNSNSFKHIKNLYEQQEKRFFIEVFDTIHTGAEMAAKAQQELIDEIYKSFIDDYHLWARFTRKHKGEKKFSLNLRKTKGYETEAKEYLEQFKKIQDDFVDNRLTWNISELVKTLTKERLMPYISPVVEKFATRTENTFKKLKSTHSESRQKTRRRR